MEEIIRLYMTVFLILDFVLFILFAMLSYREGTIFEVTNNHLMASFVTAGLVSLIIIIPCAIAHNFFIYVGIPILRNLLCNC